MTAGKQTYAENAYSIRSVHRVCDILDLLKSSALVPLADVAKVAQLPKTSAFRYLATLESRRYVQRDYVTGGYRLGFAFLDVPTHQLDRIAAHARPHLERLCELTGETVNLGVLDNQHVLYLEIVEPDRGVRLAAQRGDREPIHCSALGKMLASRLRDEQVRAILRSVGMPRRTPATITDVEAYLREIAGVRSQDYALDDRENETDGRCIAIALPDGPVAAAISMSAPAARFPIETVAIVAAQLHEAAARLTEEIEGDGP